MEFRLLGPLEARHDGRALQLGGPKQQALLAFLLLNANRVVAVDRLIDELWGEDPPETARTALQVYVSRLRRVLPANRLRTRPPGYVLEAAEGEVDAVRFEGLAAAGRAALADGEADRARERLGEACELWTGPALAGLPLGFEGRAEAARLDELRVATLEDRVETDLALGRHAELVGELEALVARHPLRERLRGQLMLALYRSARQADALEAYRDARRALVDELGIEPGAALQRLERAVLEHDTALDAPARTGDRGTASRPAPLARERKLASVLFADLNLAERPGDPEREGALLARVHETATRAIEEAGGRTERGIADALLATFGLPAALEHHTERALAAALALRARLEAEFGQVLRPRIGVESGEVIAEEGARPSASGGPVTAAARLVRSALPGQILVGERAAVVGRARFELGAARGQAYLLLGPRSGGEPRPAALARRTFVGRERELGRLHSTFAHVVRSRTPHLVTITGEPGVGKSSLVGRLAEELGAEPRWLVGRCVPFGRTGSYRPLGDIVRAALGLGEDASAETVLEQLGERTILGLTLGLDVAAGLHPTVARERLWQAWYAFVADLAADRPAALVVEDVHWADADLLALLGLTAAEVSGPVLVLTTTRPEVDEAAPVSPDSRETTRIELAPLPDHEVERLLVALVGPDASAGLHAAVLAAADGNPFFVEELVAALADRELLDEPPAERISVPDSIHAVLASRLDLLGPDERAALQLGSVFGRVFPEGAVRQLLGLQADFALLEQRGLVHRTSSVSVTGDAQLSFKHALTREVAYGTLARGGRAQLHAAVAEWLEPLVVARDEQAPVLAHHYAQAAGPEDAELAWPEGPDRIQELRRKAVLWLRRAADAALGRHEVEGAIALWRRGVELEDDLEARADLWHEIARACNLRYDGEGFLAAVEAALALSPDNETEAWLKAELAAVTAARAGMWQRRPRAEVVEGWIARALELAAPDAPSRALALAAKAIWRPRGHRAEALEAAELAGGLDDADLHRYAFDALTTSAIGVGDYSGALLAAEQWASRHSDVDDPDDRVTPWWHAAWASMALARFDDARTGAARIEALSAHLSPHHAVHVIGLLIAIEKLAGRWDAALRLVPRVEQTVAACTASGTACAYVPRSLLTAALAHALAGSTAEADRLELDAEALGYEGWDLALDPTRIKLALARGDRQEAARLARRMPSVGPGSLDALTSRLDGLAVAGDSDAVEADAVVAPPGGYLEPFALRALGIVRAAPDLLERAATRFDELGLDWHASTTRNGIATRSSAG